MTLPCVRCTLQRNSEDLPLTRFVLAIVSWLGLVLGVLWTVDAASVERFTSLTLTLRTPVAPLLLSLACALAVVASSSEPDRVIRRVATVAWLSLIAATLLVVALIVFFRRAPGDLYPNGDQAILEIYTLHATRGVWALGPYSQFGWHHPGPLYFHLLAPLYLLSGHKTIALHAAAFAINLVSLCAIGYALIRYAAPAVACAAALVLGAYLMRIEPIVTSYWNPHIVIVPAALYLVLAASVATGQHRALPACALVGSFLAQTHISLVPYVVVLASGAGATAVWWRQCPQERDRSARRWLVASGCVLIVVWLLPIIEQATQSPGNITRIVRFFGDPSPGQEPRAALLVWGDLICALFRPHLEVPEGLPLSIPDRSMTPAALGAIAQAVMLIAASVGASRRQERFHAALAALGLLGSIVGLWSITRVKSLVGDYTGFGSLRLEP